MIALDENKLKTQRTCFRINVEIALLFILPTALVNCDYFAQKKSRLNIIYLFIYFFLFFLGGGGHYCT